MRMTRYLLVFVILCYSSQPLDAALRTHQIHNAVKQLQSKNWHTRWQSLQLLGSLGKAQKQVAWPKLLGPIALRLQDNHPMVRSAAALALNAFGPHSSPALASLVKALQDPNQMVGLQAALAIGSIGPKAWATVQQLTKHPSFRVKKRIALALPAFGIQALPILLRYLRLAHPTFQLYALQAMTKLASLQGIEAALPLLLQRIQSPKQEVRHWTFQVLQHMGYRAKAAVPALQKLVAHPAPQMRSAAISALGKIGAPAASALPALLLIASKPGPQQCEAIGAIGLFGTSAGSATPTLTSLLRPAKAKQTRRPCVARSVIVALGHIGPDAATALEILAPYLTHADPWLVHSTIKSIGAIKANPPRSVALLLPFLQANNLMHQRAAIEAIGHFGDAAKGAIPLLGRLLKQPLQPGSHTQDRYAINELQDAILATLQRFGVSARPAYQAGLASRSHHVREVSINALCQMGALAAPALRAITLAVKDKHYRIRFRAIEAIGLLGIAGRSAAPAVRKALQDKHHWVRYYALRTLVQLRAYGARNAIQALLRDPSPFVQQEARKSLQLLNVTPTSAPAPTAPPTTQRATSRKATTQATTQATNPR